MSEYRYGGHTVSRLTVHLVWVTKYRYKVLTGDIQKRCRELLIQVCDTEDVRILSGVVSKGSYPQAWGLRLCAEIGEPSRGTSVFLSFI